MAENNQPLRFESLSVYAGQDLYSGTGAVNAPIFASTSFTFENSANGADIFAGRVDAYAYSRLANPTVAVVEQRIAALEGGVAALAASSGEAARWMAITGLVTAGQNIIAASNISEDAQSHFKYRFPSHGIVIKFVDIDDTKAIHDAIDDKTRAVYVESVSSTGLIVSDIEAISTVAHAAGIPVIVDNTAGAGGYLHRPIDHGADIVVHSSDWISVSGLTGAGAIVDSGNFPWNIHTSRFPHLTEPAPGYHGLNFWEQFGNKAYIFYVRMAIMRDVGPCLNPFAAFSLLSGLETLSVRIDRHCGNALALATWLEKQEKASKVVYPGLQSHPHFTHIQKYQRHGYGGLIYFQVAGGEEASKLFIGKLKLAVNADGIGTSQTLVRLEEGHQPGIRVSVGLEHVSDLIEDFHRALE